MGLIVNNLSAREILDALVSFPTVSHDTNIPLVDWVEAYLTGLGIQSHRLVKPDEPTKHAIFCSVGPNVPGGVVLSGHTDVVPVAGQDWTSDPWTVTEREGKLFGRGTCDMKGFDALALHALQRAIDSDLKRPLQIAHPRGDRLRALPGGPQDRLGLHPFQGLRGSFIAHAYGRERHS